MKTQTIEYSNGKQKFIGYLAWDETQTGKRPDVVVFPEAFGLNAHARERADRLAKLGYVALAADFHGDGRVFNDLAALRPSMQALYGDRVPRPHWTRSSHNPKWMGIERPRSDSASAARRPWSWPARVRR